MVILKPVGELILLLICLYGTIGLVFLGVELFLTLSYLRGIIFNRDYRPDTFMEFLHEFIIDGLIWPVISCFFWPLKI